MGLYREIVLRFTQRSVPVSLATSTELGPDYCPVQLLASGQTRPSSPDETVSVYVVWTAGRYILFFPEVKTMPPSWPWLPDEEMLGRKLPRVAGSVWGLLMLMGL